MILVVGKGGVGKTTFSAILGLAGSMKGETIVSSIDPAHHLGDVLGIKLEHKFKKIRENLYANEADIDELINDYLSVSIDILKNTYKDISALNLDRYFEALKDAPGVEIEAMFHYILAVRRKKENARIIIDTPATSITLRLISLPWVQEAWVDNLIDLRSKIIGYKEVIESVKSGKKIEIEDRVLKELLRIKEEVENTKRVFSDPSNIRFIGVTTAEKLPLLDLERLNASLKRKGISLHAVVLNRYVDNEDNHIAIKSLKNSMHDVPIILVPQFQREIIGIEEILKAMEKIKVV